MSHIVIVTSSFPVDFSGAEAAGSFVEEFANELSKRARVTVLAPGTGPERTGGRNYHIKYYAVPRLPLSLLNPYSPADWPAILSTVRSGMLAVNNLVQEGHCDHIFAFWILPSGYWARKALQQTGIPYSVWALGSDIWTLGRIPLVRGILEKVINDAATCFADGYRLLEDIRMLAGRDGVFLPSARQLDTSGNKTYREHPPYHFVFIGRWHQNKGVDLLLAALAVLPEASWQRVGGIRIFGGGPLEETVVSETEKLRKHDRPVTVGGFLDKQQATREIMQADYLLIPSRRESIPVIYSDAAQCGTPVIATPTGDLPIMLDKYRNGILASEISPVAYARAVTEALDKTPAEFTSGMENARREFNIPAIVDNYLKCINHHQS